MFRLLYRVWNRILCFNPKTKFCFRERRRYRRPNIELASTPGDSHWFDEPPVLGPDPILSSEHENVNIDTSYVTQYAGDRHGKFWNYVKIMAIIDMV